MASGMASYVALILLLWFIKRSGSSVPLCTVNSVTLVAGMSPGSYVTHMKHTNRSLILRYELTSIELDSETPGHAFLGNRSDCSNCQSLPFCIDGKIGVIRTTKTYGQKFVRRYSLIVKCIANNGLRSSVYFEVRDVCPYDHLYFYFNSPKFSSCLQRSYAKGSEKRLRNKGLTFVSDGSLHIYSFLEFDPRFMALSPYNGTFLVTVTGRRMGGSLTPSHNVVIYLQNKLEYFIFSINSQNRNEKIIVPLEWPVYEYGNLLIDVSVLRFSKVRISPPITLPVNLPEIPKTERHVSTDYLATATEVPLERNTSKQKPERDGYTESANGSTKRLLNSTTKIPDLECKHATKNPQKMPYLEETLEQKIPLTYKAVKLVGFSLQNVCKNSTCLDLYREEYKKKPSKQSNACTCCTPIAKLYRRCQERKSSPELTIKPTSLAVKALNFVTLKCFYPVEYLGSDIQWLKDGKKADFGREAETYRGIEGKDKLNFVTIDILRPQHQGYYECTVTTKYQVKVFSKRLFLLIKDRTYLKFTYDSKKAENLPPKESNNLKSLLVKQINESFVGNGINSTRNFAVKVIDRSYEIDVTFVDINLNSRTKICKKLKNIHSSLAKRGSFKVFSYDCCMPSSGKQFPSTLVNSSATAYRALNSTFKQLLTGTCVWNGTHGAQWSVTNITLIQTSYTVKELSRVPLTESNTLEVSESLVNATNRTKQTKDSFDVKLTVQIMENVLAAKKSPAPQIAENLLKVTSNVMDFDVSVIAKSQRKFATSERIVKLLQNISDDVKLVNSSLKIERKNIALLVFEVKKQNVSSIAINAYNDSSGQGRISTAYFTNATSKCLEQKEASIFLNASTVKAASVMSNSNNLRITSFVFQNAKLFLPQPTVKILGKGEKEETLKTFHEKDPQKRPRKARNKLVNSRVISASFKGVHLKDLSSSDEIEIDFLPLRGVEGKNSCVFWDFHAAGGKGDWSSKGCYSRGNGNGYHKCRCNHLTNFALLVEVDQGSRQLTKSEKKSLSIVTYIGCAISLFCLLITFITYAAFRNLRKKLPAQILMLLCISLMLMLVAFLAGSRAKNRTTCCVLGILIHYFLLTSFCWMAVEGVNLYLCLVKIMKSRVSKFMLKCNLFAWGIPAIVVAITAGVTRLRFYGRKEDNEYICILTGLPFYLAGLLPILVILIINIVILLLVMKSLAKKSPVSKSNQLSNITKVRIAIGCALLMGVTWTVGLFAIGELKYVVQLIFCALNSLQGLFIFVMYCGRHSDVRQEWKKFLGIESSTTSSSGTNKQSKNTKRSRATHSSSANGTLNSKSKSRKAEEIENLKLIKQPHESKPYDGVMLINKKKCKFALPGDDAEVVLLRREELSSFKH